MENNYKYRILELSGLYRVQVLHQRAEKNFWGKESKTESWDRVGPEIFYSLEQARNFIQSRKKHLRGEWTVVEEYKD